MRRFLNNCKKRCIFCEEKNGAIHIPQLGKCASPLLGDWVHKSCVVEIVCSPEKYPAKTIYIALAVGERIRLMDIEKARIPKRCVEMCIGLT